MNKTIVISAITGVAVAGVTVLSFGGYYAYANYVKTYTDPKDMVRLVKKGKSLRCEVEDDQMKAVEYIDAKNRRSRMEVIESKRAKGDSNVDVMGMSEPDRFILTQDKSYLWNSKDKQGIILEGKDMPMDKDEFFTDFNAGELDNEGKDVGESNVSIKCKYWRVKESYFTKPEDVEFKSLKDMFKDAFDQMKDDMVNDAKDTYKQGLDEMRDEFEQPDFQMDEEDFRKMIEEAQKNSEQQKQDFERFKKDMEDLQDDLEDMPQF